MVQLLVGALTCIVLVDLSAQNLNRFLSFLLVGNDVKSFPIPKRQ